MGGIDEKYDIAASTASNAFDSLVVEDVETSNKCFDFCRRVRFSLNSKYFVGSFRRNSESSMCSSWKNFNISIRG